jgi:anti-sigma B factor antagonist
MAAGVATDAHPDGGVLALERQHAPRRVRCSRSSTGHPSRPDTVFVLDVQGDLDEDLVAEMRAAVFSAASERPYGITIDLADVSFVDTAALRTLIASRRRCVAGGIRFTRRRPSHAVQRLLKVTHLDAVFQVEEDHLAAA